MSGKCTISRTFEFINYNIPPEAKDIEEKFDYTTIGFFDALRTELLDEVPECSNEATSPDAAHTEHSDAVPGNVSEKTPFDAIRMPLHLMYEKNENYALQLDGTYSFQNTLGLRCGSREEDTTFWSYDPKLPLTFVTFLQLHGYPSTIDSKGDSCEPNSAANAEDINKESTLSYPRPLSPCSLDNLESRMRKAVEKTLNEAKEKSKDSEGSNTEDSKVEFLCYQTFDKNDFIVGIKTNRYYLASELLLNAHITMRSDADSNTCSVSDSCSVSDTCPVSNSCSVSDSGFIPYPILYSYSIFCIHNTMLYKEPEGAWVKTITDANEKIASISFQGVVNTFNHSIRENYRRYVNKLEKVLYEGTDPQISDDEKEKQRRSYDIIGDYDFRYIARDVPMINLLKAMSTEGPLNYGSDSLKKSLYSSMLVLNIQSPETASDASPDVENGNAGSAGNSPVVKNDIVGSAGSRHPNDTASARCNDLRDKLKVWGKAQQLITDDPKGSLYLFKPSSSQTISNREYATRETIFVSLWKLLGSLTALERAPARKYDFESLYWPCRRLIEVLTSNQYNDWQNFERLPRLIQCLSNVLHGTLRTDIQFFQVSDFNVFVHYAPAKLRAFYNVWIKELVDYYKLFQPEGTDNVYEFVISTSNYPVIRTRELDRKNNQKLILKDDRHPAGRGYRIMFVDVPERLLYQPGRTCLILAHEVAHFGGGLAKRRVASDCDPKFGAPSVNRLEVYIQCLSAWYAMQYHTALMTEIHDRAEKGSNAAGILQIFLQFFLGGFEQDEYKPIDSTLTYGGIYTYLTKQMTESLNKPGSDSGLSDIRFSKTAASYAGKYMISFMDERPRPGLFLNSSIVFSSLESDLENFIADYWYNDNIRTKLEEALGSLPDDMTENGKIHDIWNHKHTRTIRLWNNGLMQEVMDVFHTCGLQTDHGMSVLLALNAESKVPTQIMDMIKECHADLFSIISMHLGPEHYFDIFLRSNQLYQTKGQDNLDRPDNLDGPDNLDNPNNLDGPDNLDNSDNLDDCDVPVEAAVRILLVMRSLTFIADSDSPDDADFLAAWSNLDPLAEDKTNPGFFIPKPIKNSLSAFWNTIDLENFRITSHKESSYEWLKGNEMLTFSNLFILEKIRDYLVACGREMLSKPCPASLKETAALMYSSDIFGQMEHIDQMLWDYEKTFSETYETIE